jgi:HSP20 family protein
MLITRNPRSRELFAWEDAIPKRLARMLDLPLFTPPLAAETFPFIPPLDVADFEDHIKITAELPGLNKDDVKLEIDNGMLLVRGEKKEKKEEKTDKMYLLERSYGLFERSFTLPPNLDLDRAKAEFENGVLSVKVPKQAAKNGRKLEIVGK